MRRRSRKPSASPTPPPTPTTIGHETEEVRKAAKFLVHAIDGVAVAVALTGIWSIFDSDKVASAVATAVESQFAYNLALIALYASLYRGAKFDVAVQQNHLIGDLLFSRLMQRRNLVTTVSLIVVFAAFLVLLFLFRVNDLIFALLLPAYIAANFFSWRFIARTVAATIRASRRRYRDLGDHPAIERVALVEQYIGGTWQKLRFLAMIAYSLLHLALCLALKFAPETVKSLVGMLPKGKTIAPLLPLAPSLSFLVYILASEIWMWYQRAVLRVRINIIDSLAKRYLLAPR